MVEEGEIRPSSYGQRRGITKIVPQIVDKTGVALHYSCLKGEKNKSVFWKFYDMPPYTLFTTGPNIK